MNMENLTIEEREIVEIVSSGQPIPNGKTEMQADAILRILLKGGGFDLSELEENRTIATSRWFRERRFRKK